MILTAKEIRTQVEGGNITISPFESAMLNPNSYNYHLGPTLRVYPPGVHDSLRPPSPEEVVIPAEGLVLQPRQLYIGNTVERIGSSCYVPSLIGRSSLGRLGMYLQLSADLGNLGASHQWTLEITVVQPLRVYPGMACGQVSFWVPLGEVSLYEGLLGTLSPPTVPSATTMRKAFDR
ncbi:dCTP deaminase [Paenarthrobacter sp. TA1.8]|uniref:dCTP deaminase n=1 Tax=Paenarthrobacter sp. TA1.8 TaxID=3400219 RepID=UPI003B42B736